MKTHSASVQQATAIDLVPSIRLFVYTLLVAASLPAVSALGSPAGELDPAFGNHGRILLREARFAELSGVKAFADPASGKLLVAAYGWADNVLLGFTNDGLPDAGFGDQGMMTLELGDDSLHLLDVELLAGGKLLIAGVMNAYGDSANVIHGMALLARVDADGELDDSFGSHGMVILERGGVYESFSEILIRADGSIVVLGSTDRTGKVERILARYTKDGLPDTSFGDAANAGTSTIDLADNEYLAAIVPQDDGSFMACGNATLSNRSPVVERTMVIRIRADGLRDGSFGSNGKVLLGDRQSAVEVRDCLALPDAHLAIAGIVGSDAQQRAAILRVTPDGRLDAGFANNGLLTLPTAGPATAEAMLLLIDGSLAIGGTRIGATVDERYPWIDMLVARVDPTTGRMDREFGNGGATTIDFGMRRYASRAVPASLLQQADGKLVVVGAQFDPGDWWDTPYTAIARVDPYGSGSNGFAGLNEVLVLAPAGGGDVTLHVRRTGGSTGPLSVDYRTVDDTAIAGSDYVANSGTLSWLDGDMSERVISITVSTAQLATNFEFFKVELFDSSGGLAVDQATIELSRNPPVAPLPPGDGNSHGNANLSGGGALGIESLLLLGPAALGLRRRQTIARKKQCRNLPRILLTPSAQGK